jgi:hypothetical protein
MSDELEFVIEELAFHVAHHDKQKVAEAERMIRRLITRARQEYREAGAPYGDTVAGFLIWLESANRLTPSA